MSNHINTKPDESRFGKLNESLSTTTNSMGQEVNSPGGCRIRVSMRMERVEVNKEILANQDREFLEDSCLEKEQLDFLIIRAQQIRNDIDHNAGLQMILPSSN